MVPPALNFSVWITFDKYILSEMQAKMLPIFAFGLAFMLAWCYFALWKCIAAIISISLTHSYFFKRSRSVCLQNINLCQNSRCLLCSTRFLLHGGSMPHYILHTPRNVSAIYFSSTLQHEFYVEHLIFGSRLAPERLAPKWFRARFVAIIRHTADIHTHIASGQQRRHAHKIRPSDT